MIVFTKSDSTKDLEGILALQKANIAANLPLDEIREQGFVTVCHTYNQLAKLNNEEKHIIAKDGGRVVGYLLAMTAVAKADIPVLVPMFAVFDATLYKGQPIAAYHYIVVGQVAIDKAYRGRGLLDQCYAAYKKEYSGRYDFAITEIAQTNARSLNAHKRIGFQPIKNYTGPDNVEWVVVLWDWKNEAEAEGR